MDALSNVKMIDHIKADAHAAGVITPQGSVDMAEFQTVVFNVVMSDKGSAGTLDAKLQWSDQSAVGSGTWTDDDGSTGNLKAITQLTANGSARLQVLRPLGRYYKVVFTIAGNTSDAYCAGAGIPANKVPVSYS